MPPAPPAPRRAAPGPDARAALAGATAAAGAARQGRSSGLTAEQRLARREARPTRRWLLIGAGLVVIAALAIVLATRGSSSPTNGGAAPRGSSETRTSSTGSKHKSATRKSTTPAAKVTPPGELAVTVLNGTESEGLARRVASELQQGGYSQAAAAFGRPPGANEATVVEYASGHQADAEALAHSLSVSHVLPVEQAVSALAPSAKVVVVVGTDKATT
jgi:hypothetical protein